MTELKVKMSEMADEYEYNHYHECKGVSDCCYDNKPIEDAFKAGFRAALELPEVQELVELLERSLKVRDFEVPEDIEVKALGERIGFGALLGAAAKGWHQSAKESGYPPGGVLTVGHCHATVESVLSTWKAFKENHENTN